MEQDLDDYWQGSYGGLYSSIATDDHYIDSGDIQEYDIYSSTASIVGSVYSPMSTNPPQIPVHSGTYHDQNAPYLHAPNNRLHALQQLPQINTQLTSHHTNDMESSTTSSSSFPKVFTPYSQLHFQPAVQISSPQSAPVDGGVLMAELEKKSPLPVSPSSFYLPDLEGDTLYSPTSSHPMESDVLTQTPLPHILEWKRVMELCGADDFVPQNVYQPYTEADRKRYIRDIELHETVFFQSDDSVELGISLDDVLKQRLKRLKAMDDLMFYGCGPSVSIRIQWPGYAPWSKQIPTTDFKNPKGPITRAKLAKNIATCVRRFIEIMQDRPMEADSDPSWKVGKRHIKVEDLTLVSLHHVSKGSWQPQLRFRSLPSTLSHQWRMSLPSASVSRS